MNKCGSRTDINPPFAFDIGFSRKFLFPLFPPPGAANPQKGRRRGEDTSGTRLRPHAKFGVNRPAGCREIVDQKNEQNTYSIKLIPRPSL